MTASVDNIRQLEDLYRLAAKLAIAGRVGATVSSKMAQDAYIEALAEIGQMCTADEKLITSLTYPRLKELHDRLDDNTQRVPTSLHMQEIKKQSFMEDFLHHWQTLPELLDEKGNPLPLYASPKKLTIAKALKMMNMVNNSSGAIRRELLRYPGVVGADDQGTLYLKNPKKYGQHAYDIAKPLADFNESLHSLVVQLERTLKDAISID